MSNQEIPKNVLDLANTWLTGNFDEETKKHVQSLLEKQNKRLARRYHLQAYGIDF